MTNTVARHQVIEIRNGYVVCDTKTGSIVSRTYKSIGWAIRSATRWNDITKNFRYT